MIKALKDRTNVLLFGFTALVLCLVPGLAHAAEGGASAAQSIINEQISGLTAAATPIITGALGVAALFFAAKFLWTKFKSIAR